MSQIMYRRKGKRDLYILIMGRQAIRESWTVDAMRNMTVFLLCPVRSVGIF